MNNHYLIDTSASYPRVFVFSHDDGRLLYSFTFDYYPRENRAVMEFFDRRNYPEIIYYSSFDTSRPHCGWKCVNRGEVLFTFKKLKDKLKKKVKFVVENVTP